MGSLPAASGKLPASLRLGASGCVDASRRIEADHDGPDRIVTDRSATQRNATHDKRTRVGRPLVFERIMKFHWPPHFLYHSYSLENS